MSMNMSTIEKSLYLGGIEALSDTDKLKQLGVTHILTVDIHPPTAEISDLFVTKHINAQDISETDLLYYFEESTQFIEEGKEKGGVLVHCFAGVSRSATFVCAYLMKKSSISFQKVLELVKTQRPEVNPNLGFQQQLLLYERMGYKIDQQYNGYRQYRLMKLSKQVQDGDFQHDKSLPDDAINAHVSEKPNQNSYKCRKCRKILFKSGSLLSHNVGEGEIAFDWRGKAGVGADDDSDVTPCDRSIFIEPLKWMISYIKNVEGKIPCPHCSAKLGSFVWYGERCPCGTWVAPAFHIQSSKVDICKPINLQHR